MARYDKQHKDATRARIVDTAGRRLKSSGIDGSGVATLMKDAGLTNGAFYAHFDSKDALVAEVVGHQLGSQLQTFEQLSSGAAGVDELVAGYLTPGHRDAPGEGCPSAALLEEIARAPEVVRQAYTDGVLAIVDEIASRFAGPDEPAAHLRVQALSVYALMVGTIQLARTLTDPEVSGAVIEQGLANARALLAG